MNSALMTANYASKGADPLQRLDRTARQDAAVSAQLFDPQYQKALRFATDPGQQEAQAGLAQEQAQRGNTITRGEFMRTMGRSGSAVDPRVAAENDRLLGLGQVANIAGAGNDARLTTYGQQTGLLDGLTKYGLAQAGLAQGLRSGAAAAYQARINTNKEADAMQKQAEAAAMQSNIGLGLNAAMSLGSFGLAKWG